KQEFEDDSEIQSFCRLKFGVSFPVLKRIDVNGKEELPLYTWLKSQKGGVFGSRIKWNFTKFLIDKHGTVVDRFSPSTKPEKIEKYIVKMLEEK
ncbi:Glutathione peroxidase like protein, partial [Aduncisulcus paluster]